jgi:hypothetical protein
MKQLIKAIFFMLVLAPIISEASISSGRATDRINYQTSNYNGVEYRIFLTMDQIVEYKNFDINKSAFPKSLNEIIAVAKKQISKIDSAASWEANNINLQMGYLGNNEKYWYYQISFSNAGRNYFTMLVTIDGKPAKIVMVTEELLE